jgi:hypothetical protein
LPSEANTGPIEKRVNLALRKGDFHLLDRLNRDDRRVWRVLQSNLYQTDETLRWHAIEAIAILLLAQWDLGRREKVRDYMRRLVWSISDESGGIGWSAPQTIAAIVTAIPELSEPFVNIMIDRAFGEPALVRSGLWGIGRLGRKARPSMELFRDIVLASFSLDEPETLGLAAWAMGEARYRPALPYLSELLRRPEVVRIYVPPRFVARPLADWAQGAIEAIERDEASETPADYFNI